MMWNVWQDIIFEDVFRTYKGQEMMYFGCLGQYEDERQVEEGFVIQMEWDNKVRFVESYNIAKMQTNKVCNHKKKPLSLKQSSLMQH